MSDTTVAKVPNRYLMVLRNGKSRSTSPAATLASCLSAATTAMESGAWIGGKGEAFGADLAGRRTALRTAGDTALAEFDDAMRGQPEMVEPNSWAARYGTGRGPI